MYVVFPAYFFVHCIFGVALEGTELVVSPLIFPPYQVDLSNVARFSEKFGARVLYLTGLLSRGLLSLGTVIFNRVYIF